MANASDSIEWLTTSRSSTFVYFGYDAGSPFSVREIIVNGFGVSPHELRQLRLFALYCIARGRENRCGKGNLHGRDI
jgi:hypothetical protein